MKYYLSLFFIFVIGCTNRSIINEKVNEKINVKKITEQGMSITYYSNIDDELKINDKIKKIHKGKNSFYHVENQKVNTLYIEGNNFKKKYKLDRKNYEEEYSISHKEYLLMSLLSYAYFNESHLNKSIYEVLINNKEELMSKISLFYLLGIDKKWNEFIEVNKEIFSSWKILKISNVNRKNLSKELDDGFYAIAFSKISSGKKEKIVIAYRGSEIFPAKEAYKDFIKTDFFIGVGSKPLQFEEGLTFYNEVAKNHDYKNISLTGHSLGGGIAQYVAVTSVSVHNNENYIPRTVTYNAIGILVKNMICLLDFINYKNFLVADKNIPKNLRSKADKISNVFKTELPKEINMKAYQNGKKISYFFHWYNKYVLRTKLEIALIEKVKKSDLKYIVNKYYNKNFLDENLKLASIRLKKVEENEVFKDRIINFIHSKDFTGNFFPHIGSVYLIDKEYEEKEEYILDSFAKNNLEKDKNIIKYHQPNIFFPFINKESYISNNTLENLSFNINKEYLLSILKLTISSSNIKDNKTDFSSLKRETIEKIEKLDSIYKSKIIIYLKNKKVEEFKKLYIEAKNKEEISIYDILDI